MRFKRNEPLKKHTSWRIGGPASYFCSPSNLEELIEALDFAKAKGLPAAVLGSGTNVLALDDGWKGLVIKTSGGLNSIKITGSLVKVGAGITLPRLLGKLAGEGLGGLEFLAGIPGSVGGAVVMNAGAWGKQIGDSVVSVKVIDRQGRTKDLSKRKMKFAYRKSMLQGKKLIVVSVALKLRHKKKQLIYKKIREFLAQRRAGQPLGAPNCGSVFKNPHNDHAGRLIEASGCKGLRVGDAQVSSKHANFILNLGEAKARDVIKLMSLVQDRVKKTFKILLEPEIKIMVKSSR